MLTALTFSLFVIVVAFPQTAIGQTLRRWLVEVPARVLSRVRPGWVAAILGLVAVGTILVILFEGEGLRVFGMLAPETATWFALFDVSLFLDAILIAATVAATRGARVIRDRTTALVSRGISVARRVSNRARDQRDRSTKPRPPRLDDTDRWPAGASWA